MKPQVLVVDDSLTVRMDLRGALSAAGFSVTACETKREAEKALRERTFSLAVLDVILPDGSGIDLLGMIRGSDELAHLPVIVLSTEAEVRDRVKGLTTGADEYVGKPYDITYLVRRARALCERTSGEETGPVAAARRILAVDDSPTFLTELACKLREDGHDVVLAHSGVEALELLAVQSVDCVVLDLVMPDVDGIETLRRLRRMPGRESTPTVMLTASEDPALARRATDAGASDFLHKSVNLDAVRARIRNLLRNRRAAQASAAPSRASSAEKPPASRPRDVASEKPLLARVIAAMGLSPLLARNVLSKACSRAGVDASALGADGIRRALPCIREALHMFYSVEEAQRRTQEMAALVAPTSDHPGA
ncbi:response regulator [Polyangium jinanense]|uniref:Response regulator n=1 Tax=Polyangium jinanense TaxID=2829994 RepID=A0A9X3WYW4_9BACT|nr:response regulator [Polyangium jinanense]MDC3952994.1 response regulator [Polyangium jinanense]MDC3980612.1 response regulator [Polyangium jinanense]